MRETTKAFMAKVRRSVKRWRESKNFSIDAAAARSGAMSGDRWAEIEGGRGAEVTAAELFTVAEALGLEVAVLLEAG